MNKIIIMSEQPKWLAKILNGDKTIDIRKTKPNCELPIDVYLYCTKGVPLFRLTTNDKKERFGNRIINGKVVAKFTLNKAEDCCDMSLPELEDKSLLNIDEICSYIKAKEVDPKMVYAWHIDNLVIFDKPMELGEFYRDDKKWSVHYRSWVNVRILNDLNKFKLTKAPQSWQYAYIK